MAIIDKNGNRRGKFGNASYRLVNGVNVVQSTAGKGNTKIAPGSIKSSKEFCLASNRARIIRNVLQPMTGDFYDGKMINRLNSALVKVIRSNNELAPGHRDLRDGQLNLLNGFDFNQHSLFSDYFKVQIQQELSSAGLKLTIPSFNPQSKLAFPFDASFCVLKVLVSALDLEAGKFSYCCSKSLTIAATETLVPVVEWNLIENFPSRGLLMVSASLNYRVEGLGEMISLNRPKMHPCQLLSINNAEYFSQGPIVENPSPLFGKWFPVAGKALKVIPVGIEQDE